MYASGRRLGVVRRRARDEQAAERAVGGYAARRAVARVEAPLEADLDEDACSLDLLDRRIDRREVEGHGLLAERGEAGARSQLERARVRGVDVAITSASAAATRSAGVAAREAPS